MIGNILMQHVRDIVLRVYKDRLVYSIPKYLPDEFKSYKYEIKDYPGRLEIVLIGKKEPEDFPGIFQKK